MLELKDKAEKVKEELETKEIADIAIDRMRWANRRRMAWVFSYAAMIFAFLVFSAIILGDKPTADRITFATDLLTWLFMGLISIPSLYFGGTVIEKFTGSNTRSIIPPTVTKPNDAPPKITPG